MQGKLIDQIFVSPSVSGVTDNSTEDDGAVPDPGTLLIYLTTAANCTGESSLGDDRPDSDPCR